MSDIIKTAAGLVNHCKQALAEKWGYVFGAIGQKCTIALLDAQAKRHPENNLAGGQMRKVGEKWLGKTVVDCSGLIKSYLMSDVTGGPITYSQKYDLAVQYGAATVKGNISTMPDTPGVLVYMPGHVGVYIGNGEVIESAGTYYGVVKSKLPKCHTGNKWTGWYQCPYIEYPKNDEKPSIQPTPSVPDKEPDPPKKEPDTGKESPKIDVTYRVRTQRHAWLPAVKNLEDYAGWQDSPITDVAIKVSKGRVKYRAHVLGGGWLPYVTGYSTSDSNNGYAGIGKPIDALEVYYYTPDGIRPYRKAKYRVSPIGGNYYSWQYDNETKNGQDGYAGMFGKAVGKVQIVIE